MKHRVDELEGAMLDAAVAMAKGEEPGADYSASWHHGGSIIEREGIELLHNRGDGTWCARIFHPTAYFIGRGPTPLIASMRCYVRSKFGEFVELPEVAS